MISGIGNGKAASSGFAGGEGSGRLASLPLLFGDLLRRW